MPAIIGAFRTLDCANKVRIHYVLAQPITPRLLTRIPNVNLTIQEFSRMVPDAKDHFVATLGLRLRATGTVGESKMVVTYGKTEGDSVDDNIHEFEKQLGELA